LILTRGLSGDGHSEGFTLGSFSEGDVIIDYQKTISDNRSVQGTVHNYRIVGGMTTGTGNLILNYTDVGATLSAGNTAYLRLRDLTYANGSTAWGFDPVASGATVGIYKKTDTGFTSSISKIGIGNGTVPENGITWHSATEFASSSLGGPSGASAGTSTYDPPFEHTPAAWITGFKSDSSISSFLPYAKDHWVVLNHPNLRNDINAGISFGNVDIHTFSRELTFEEHSGFRNIHNRYQSINYPYIGFTG
jgi:hypothetical protein